MTTDECAIDDALLAARPEEREPEDRAPPAERFPKTPIAWYVFCHSADLARGPYSKDFLGQRIIAYRLQDGSVVAMDARCSHMGSDLGAGRVVNDCIECPFHDWQYGPDGRCRVIPAQEHIPKFARQRSYPVQERHGLIYLFNASDALFPLPFFDGVSSDELMRSRPFGTVLDCPWYVSGANAFDLQHFRAAHDRRLITEPSSQQRSPYSFAAVGIFAVEGHSLQDRITRRFAGDQVRLSITDWCGGLSFAQAEFRRTSTFGLVAREPLVDGRVRVDVYVFSRKGRNVLRRNLLDPIHLEIRRLFIKRFLTADAIRLNGVRYRPERLIEADREMINYYRWLAASSHGKSPGARAGDERGL